ncbi:MAG: hypothetical protein V4510_10835 [bacterium]
MNHSSRLMIGAAILALGAGTVWFASTQAPADVRQVDEVVGNPAGHMRGSFTLVGVPQPEQVPVTVAQGVVLQENPEWRNETRTTTTWFLDGQLVFSLHTLTASAGADGALHWSFRNETRRHPTDLQPVVPVVAATWVSGLAGQAFPIDGFSAEQGHPARIWAIYGKATEHPLQPKPSQFKGHLMASLPDGTPVPDGALIWVVQDYTAGCSSKFLPPEAQAKYNVTA